MPGCSVPYCRRRADQGFRLFVFPKDLKRRELWTRLCNREEKPPPKHARICEYHFADDQFVRASYTCLRGKLKNNAIPTIFDTSLSVRKIFAIKSKKRQELSKINCDNRNLPTAAEQDIRIDRNFGHIQPEFVDVSQHDDNSLWRNDFDADSLEQPFEENSLQRVDHQPEIFNPIEEDFNRTDNFDISNASIEQLCVEPKLPENRFESAIESDTFNLKSFENNNLQIIMDRTKVLEEQLREKDVELEGTKRLLSKSLKQVEKLKALNDRLQTQILELSGKIKPEYYFRLRNRIKLEKCSKGS